MRITIKELCEENWVKMERSDSFYSSEKSVWKEQIKGQLVMKKPKFGILVTTLCMKVGRSLKNSLSNRGCVQKLRDEIRVLEARLGFLI